MLNTSKQEFRWSIRKKGKHILNMCQCLVFAIALSTVLSATEAEANPTGGNVVAGAASISSAGQTLTVNQATSRAVIEWGNFDIAAGETTKFIQPSTSAIAINRVVNSSQITSINGNLVANGKVLVLNPNGVLIGPQGNIDVAGFIASSADVDTNSFMSGASTLNFNKAGRADAVVENQGRITIDDQGLGLLVAPTSRNSGVIEGNLARIQIGAGDTFGVDLYGDGLLHLAVEDSDATRELKAENTGTIVANASRVLMTAAAANDVVTSVINHTGVIEAKRLVAKGGEVILTGAGATVQVSGKIDASGKTGGGNIKIGGDYQGQGSLAKADNTHVTAEAVLKADAIENGDGGQIIVWAEKIGEAVGTFSVQGGVNGGNGGLVETSSLGDLFVGGAVVNALAPQGQAGWWLLDPTTINIVTSGGVSYNPALHNSFSVSGTANINVATLNAALANVSLKATQDVNFNTDVNIAAAGVGLQVHAKRDIKISNRSITTNGGFLDFQGDRDIKISNSVFRTNGGLVDFLACRDLHLNNSSINSGGGDVKLEAWDDLILNGNAAAPVIVQTEGGDISFVVTNNAGNDPNDSFSVTTGRFSTRGGNFSTTVADGTVSFQSTTVNTTGGSTPGVISVSDLADASINVTEFGNNNGFFQGDSGGLITVTAENVVPQNNNNCFKAGGTGSCAAVPDPIISLTIQADAKFKTYGAADPLLTYTLNTGALFSGDSFTGALARVAGENAGAYVITQGSLGVSSLSGFLYAITFIQNFLTINPAILTITSLDQGKTYGDALNLGTTAFTASGLQFSDAVSDVTLASAGAVATAGVGAYAIDASNPVFSTGLSSNYTIDYLPGILTVDPKALTVTANDQTKTFGSTFTFAGTEYTATGLVNGDTLGLATLTSAGAPLTAPTGTYPVEILSIAGITPNYDVSFVNGVFTVSNQFFAPQLEIDPLERPIISFANQAIVLDAPFEQIDTANLGTNVSIQLASAAGATPTTPENLADIETAAGGGTYTGTDCVNDFLAGDECQEIQE